MTLITGRSRVSQSTEGHPQSAGHTVTNYPLTRSQEGIWVDYLADRASTQYNISLEWNVVDNVGNQVKTGEIVAGKLPEFSLIHVCAYRSEGNLTTWASFSDS